MDRSLVTWALTLCLLARGGRPQELIDETFWLLQGPDEDAFFGRGDSLDTDKLKLGDFSMAPFRGDWTSGQPDLLDFLPVSSGSLGLHLFQDQEAEKPVEVILRLYQDHLVERRNLQVTVNATLTSASQTELKSTGLARIEKGDRIFEDLGSLYCSVSLEVFFLDAAGNPLNITTDLIPGMNIRGSLRSSNCTHFSFEFKTEIDNGILSLTLLGSLVWSSMILLALRPLMDGLVQNMPRILNLSLKFLLANLLGDFLLIFLNSVFTVVAHPQYFEFAVVVSMFLVSSIMIKLRIYFLIFQRRKEAAATPEAQLRKDTIREAAKICTAILCALFASTFLFTRYFAFILFFLYPLFQVAHNVNFVLKKNCLDFELHLPIVASQLWFLVFIRGLSDSVSRLHTDRLFVGILTGQVAFFLLVMGLQRTFGPKFFIPKRWRKGYYEYERRIPPHLTDENSTCPICFHQLTHSPSDNEAPLTAGLLLTKCMLTPCNHAFHRECLVQWMDFMMTCPCCRKGIPPYE